MRCGRQVTLRVTDRATWGTVGRARQHLRLRLHILLNLLQLLEKELVLEGVVGGETGGVDSVGREVRLRGARIHERFCRVLSLRHVLLVHLSI